MNTEIGKWLVVAGLLIVFGGLVVYFFGNRLDWVGHLPGDIRIEKEGFHFYFPLTTMILISIVLSILLTVIARLFRG